MELNVEMLRLPPKERGEYNRNRVSELMRKYPGITQTEIASRLGLSIMAVNRHFNAVRSEWQNDAGTTTNTGAG